MENQKSVRRKVDDSRYFQTEDYRSTYFELRHLFDIDDEKWGHPLLTELGWAFGGGLDNVIDAGLTPEERAKNGEALAELYNQSFGTGVPEDEFCDIEKVVVPGCPEEPDTPAAVYVFHPKTGVEGKAPCLVYCMGGGLIYYSLGMFPIGEICSEIGAVGIVPAYRYSYQEPYPAALNDIHAGYQWAHEHSDELGVDCEKFILAGHSSGGQLALNMGFRAKRYGYSPRGIIATNPQTDDRMSEGCTSGIFCTASSGLNFHNMLVTYAGANAGFVPAGGELFANYATVGECVGFPPTYIHTSELDPDREASVRFFTKLLQAKTFVEYHSWGGTHHASFHLSGVASLGALNDYSERLRPLFYDELNDLINFDFRRPWVEEELKENGPWW